MANMWVYLQNYDTSSNPDIYYWRLDTTSQQAYTTAIYNGGYFSTTSGGIYILAVEGDNAEGYYVTCYFVIQATSTNQTVYLNMEATGAGNIVVDTYTSSHGYFSSSLETSSTLEGQTYDGSAYATAKTMTVNTSTPTLLFDDTEFMIYTYTSGSYTYVISILEDGYNTPINFTKGTHKSSGNTATSSYWLGQMLTQSGYNLVGKACVDSSSYYLGQAMVSITNGPSTVADRYGNFTFNAFSASSAPVTISRVGVTAGSFTATTASTNMVLSCNNRLITKKDIYSLSGQSCTDSEACRCLRKSDIPSSFSVQGSWDSSRVPKGGYISFTASTATTSSTFSMGATIQNQTSTNFGSVTIWVGSSSNVIASSSTVISNSVESVDWCTSTSPSRGSQTVGVTISNGGSWRCGLTITGGGSGPGEKAFNTSSGTGSATITIPTANPLSVMLTIYFSN